MREHYLQIDLLKGLAILSVLALHTLPDGARFLAGSPLHIDQSVPIFLFLLGLNGGLSARRHGQTSFGQLVAKRVSRIGPALLVAILVSILVVPIVARWGTHEPYFGWMCALGRLPTPGPGNYFISILLQFVILEYLLLKMFDRGKGLALTVCFLLDLGFELIAPRVDLITSENYIYSAIVFRYLWLIGLGVWSANNLDMSVGILRARGWAKIVIGIGIVISTGLVVAYTSTGYLLPYMNQRWATHNLFYSFYPGALVLLGLRILPSQTSSRFWRGIAELGKASYHIFLFQIIYYVCGCSFILKDLRPEVSLDVLLKIVCALIVDVTTCCTVGWGWYRIEKRKREKLAGRFI